MVNVTDGSLPPIQSALEGSAVLLNCIHTYGGGSTQAQQSAMYKRLQVTLITCTFMCMYQNRRIHILSRPWEAMAKQSQLPILSFAQGSTYYVQYVTRLRFKAYKLNY